VLTVHAERRREEAEGLELLIGERPQGTFSRQLFLGDTLDTDQIEAEYRDGVLTLRLPITEKAKPRRVRIQASDGGATAIDASSQAEASAS
jgi:HSP20 family protein